MNLDRYMDDFGRELAGAQQRPRRRARLALALPAVGGLAAAAILVSTQRDRIDAVAEARAALLAPGTRAGWRCRRAPERVAPCAARSSGWR